jgi:hypothetical protein
VRARASVCARVRVRVCVHAFLSLVRVPVCVLHSHTHTLSVFIGTTPLALGMAEERGAAMTVTAGPRGSLTPTLAHAPRPLGAVYDDHPGNSDDRPTGGGNSGSSNHRGSAPDLAPAHTPPLDRGGRPSHSSGVANDGSGVHGGKPTPVVARQRSNTTTTQGRMSELTQSFVRSRLAHSYDALHHGPHGGGTSGSGAGNSSSGHGGGTSGSGGGNSSSSSRPGSALDDLVHELAMTSSAAAPGRSRQPGTLTPPPGSPSLVLQSDHVTRVGSVRYPGGGRARYVPYQHVMTSSDQGLMPATCMGCQARIRPLARIQRCQRTCNVCACVCVCWFVFVFV